MKSDASIYEILRNKIINLEYKPGEELDLKKIAAQLEVSRSPIRDAINRLALDKLVDIFPQKGTRVSLLDNTIIQQERFFRITLELGVVKLLEPILKNENRRKFFATKLQGVLLQQKACILNGDRTQFLMFDDAFHNLIYEETQNTWIWEVISAHTGNDHRIRVLSFNSKKITDIVDVEHKNFMEAIENGNLESAISICKAHLERLFEEFEPLQTTYPDYFI